MKNNLFWPVYRLKSRAILTREWIEEKFAEENSSDLFNFSLLESNRSRINMSYNLTRVKLLKVHLELSKLDGKQSSIEIKIRFSNILLLIYALQLVVAITCSVLTILYLENGIMKTLYLRLNYNLLIVKRANLKKP